MQGPKTIRVAVRGGSDYKRGMWWSGSKTPGPKESRVDVRERFGLEEGGCGGKVGRSEVLFNYYGRYIND